MSDKQLNVFDEVIEVCCTNPITGFYRDGFCHTDAFDRGMHVVCAKVTNDFLNFSKSRGNDLSTPRPDLNFPGEFSVSHETPSGLIIILLLFFNSFKDFLKKSLLESFNFFLEIFFGRKSLEYTLM